MSVHNITASLTDGVAKLVADRNLQDDSINLGCGAHVIPMKLVLRIAESQVLCGENALYLF